MTIARLRELLAAANATTCEAQDCHYFGKLRSSSCECERDRKQDVERLRYRAVSALPALLDALEVAKKIRAECGLAPDAPDQICCLQECPCAAFDAELRRLEEGG